jgi:hypothetical protein
MFRAAGPALALVVALGCSFAAPAAFAQSVMQQCGQQYQAAKAANTLNGMTWNQFRSDCSARLKATPASAPAPAAAAAPANPLKPVVAAPAPAPTPTVAKTMPAAPPPVAPAAAPAAPAATTTAAGKPMSAGRTAFVARERQCGAEWRANKVTLVAQTPGLTWPKYLSSCNTRLKAAGQ